MTQIETNYSNSVVQLQQNNVRRRAIKTKSIPLDEYFRREKRKNNGLIEKFYNWVKNTTGIGVGSKKAEEEIKKANREEVKAQVVLKTVHDYNTSQENSAQLLGDALSVGAGGMTFFAMNKLFQKGKALIDVNKPLMSSMDKLVEQAQRAMVEDTKMSANNKKNTKNAIKVYENIKSTFGSNKKGVLIATGMAAFVAGITKYWALKFNRIGSDEFKVDEKLYGKKKTRNAYQKQMAKSRKKQLKNERRKTNFKNFISGAINGLMSPLMLLGGVVGAPIYLVGNSLNRYFVANKTEKNKSLGGYADNLTNDIVTTGLVTAGIVIPFVKKANFTKAFNQNIEKATKKLADATLKAPDFKSNSAYKKLEATMLNNSSIKSIMESGEKVEEQIKKLTDENIFAVKFKQISADQSALTTALREKCPPTRSLGEAQNFVDKNLGSGYKLQKLLGVGTIAETYLAKDKSGKDICIKVLKEGIDKNKILKDKQKFVDMVKNMSNKTQDEKDYLLRNIDDLAEGILKEADLKNEMDAALKLAKNTFAANVVKPIEVKNNVYVMEKANGVSLSSFMDLNKLYIQKEALQKAGKNMPNNIQRLKEIEDKIKEVTNRMPSFDNIKFDKRDANYILGEYQKVFIEQFHKIDKNGKVIHADIHPGNIFIDPNVLRTKRGKLFTLIDTGNTIEMGVEQSMHALNLTNYVKQGNIQDIAEYVLNGAKLPSNLTKENALEKIKSELQKCFFDYETKLEQLNDERLLTLTDNIMQKYNIIPGSSQLNLNKSRQSAKNSLSELENALNELEFIGIIGQDSKTGQILQGGKAGLNALARNKAYDAMVAKQEKNNLKQLSPAQILKHKNNKNAPSQSSEEYLTYWLKQKMLGDIKFVD